MMGTEEKSIPPEERGLSPEITEEMTKKKFIIEYKNRHTGQVLGQITRLEGKAIVEKWIEAMNQNPELAHLEQSTTPRQADGVYPEA